METSDIRVQAFNQGADARISGVERHRNDNPKSTIARYWWFEGWDQCDAEWGMDSKGTAKPLPVLVGR